MAEKKDGEKGNNGKATTRKAKGKVVQHYQRVDFEQSLECVLTPEQIADHSKEAAQDATALARFDKTELAAKDAAKNAKMEGEVKLSHMKTHLRCVATGREHKAVLCYRQYDPDTKKVETYRIDTGALIDTRNPIGKEDQPELISMPKKETKIDHDIPGGEQDVKDRRPAGA